VLGVQVFPVMKLKRGGFVFANLICDWLGRLRCASWWPAEALELEEIAEGAGVRAFEAGLGAV